MVPAIRYLAPAQVAVLQQTAPKNTGILLLFCTVAYYLQMQGGCREGIRLPGIIVNFSGPGVCMQRNGKTPADI